MTDTPSTIEDRFIKQFTYGKFKGDVGSNVLNVGDASSIIDFMEQELAAFADETEKEVIGENTYLYGIGECGDEVVTENAENELRDQQKERLTDLKTRYGLMEGEKHE